MLFKKSKSKMSCFFEVMMVTWHREVLVLQKNELEGNKLMRYLTNAHNNIKNYFNTSKCNTLYMEELY